MFDLYVNGRFAGNFNSIAEISSYINYNGIDTTVDWVEIKRVGKYD